MKNIKTLSVYCLSCINKPCSKACPLNNNIPEFIKLVKDNNIKEAYKVLLETTVLPSICGRVCPKNRQCQGSCIRKLKGNPVSIGEIEAYVGDVALKEDWKLPTTKETNHKVAVIGSGPASLTCAAFLRRNGIQTTIYEKHDYLGGLLVHGIPDFRLSKDIVNKTIEKILETGINVEYNMELGKNIDLSTLEKEYDAVFLGIGANSSRKMNIEGEELSGVYGGNELLENKKVIDCKDKTVIVSGGGNVAIDVARTLKRQGASKVIIVYRRNKDEMPADIEEIEAALKENIEIKYQTNILKINGMNSVESIEVIKTELIKKENETRLVPVNIENTNYKIDCDFVIMAVGSTSDNYINSLNIELDKNNKILINDKYQTSNKKIFAGGDIAGIDSTVASAARSGRDAALSIIEYLK